MSQPLSPSPVRRRSGLCAAALVVTALVACGRGEESVGESVVAAVEEATGGAFEVADGSAACELLDDQLLSSHFDLAGAEVSREPSRFSPQPLCTARWRRADADEIEAGSEEAMAAYIRARTRGEEAELPIARTDDEVSLTVNSTVYDDAEATVAALDAAMRILSEGVTAEAAGREVSFQADVERVEGVGHGAAWAPRLHQLSVAGDRRVFHVTVRFGDDAAAERERAMALARDLVGKL